MPITFNCPCGETLAAEDAHVGLGVECPTCQKALTVPPGGKPVAKPASKPAATPPEKKARLDDDEDADRPRRKKKNKVKKGTGGAHAMSLMEKAHADLEEEEARRSRGGGLAISPGIVQGSISVVLGLVVLVVSLFVPCGFMYMLICAGVLILGGIVRIVLGFTGTGTD